MPKKFRNSTISQAERFLHVGRSLVTLDQLLSSNALGVGAKLQLFDDAIRRQIVTHQQLEQKNVPPNFRDFDLASEERPVPKFVASIENFTEQNIGKSFIFFWAASFLADFINVGVFAPDALVVSAISAIFICPFVFGASTLLFQKLRDSTPNMRKFRKYSKAKNEFSCFQRIHRFANSAANAKTWLAAGGYGFEYLVERFFRARGWLVERVGGANDGGVDLRITKGHERAIVQCKAYDKVIGPAIVRELYGALQHDNCSHAYLATFHGVSSAASNWLAGKPITVLSLRDFVGV